MRLWLSVPVKLCDPIAAIDGWCYWLCQEGHHFYAVWKQWKWWHVMTWMQSVENAGNAGGQSVVLTVRRLALGSPVKAGTVTVSKHQNETSKLAIKASKPFFTSQVYRIELDPRLWAHQTNINNININIQQLTLKPTLQTWSGLCTKARQDNI